MKKIIWISSFPKSGNTYVRCFLAHYMFGNNKKFDFKLIENIRKFESKDVINEVVDSKNILTSEFSHYKHFIDLQKKLIKKFDQKELIYKTHHFFGEVNNHQFTNKETTLLFIYLIRDPREVLVSYANHSSMPIDELIDSFVEENSMLKFEMNALINWRLHYKSWKSFSSVPSMFVKFEDLIDRPYEIFEKLINFLSKYINIKFEEKKFKQSIEYTKFNNLKSLEKLVGFKEAKKNNFFNTGKKNTWEEILTKNHINKIEEAFHLEMKELGYIK